MREGPASNRDNQSQQRKNGDSEMSDQKSDTHQPLETWKLNVIMAFFILLTATRFVSTKLIDTEQVTDKSGNVIEYKHPLL